MLVEKLAAMGFRLAISLLIYLAFHVGGLVIQGVIARFAARVNSSRKYVVNLLGKALKTTLMILGLVTALGTLGINVSALVAGLGLTGFALGFALKDALSNILAGVLILFYQPFVIGDRIAVAAFEGNVVNIDLRYTELDGPDNKRILIPNANLFNNVVSVLRPSGP